MIDSLSIINYNLNGKTETKSLVEKCPYYDLFWSAFYRIWTEYGEVLCISLYSVRMRENMDQNNSEYRHFLRSQQHENQLRND